MLLIQRDREVRYLGTTCISVVLTNDYTEVQRVDPEEKMCSLISAIFEYFSKVCLPLEYRIPDREILKAFHVRIQFES